MPVEFLGMGGTNDGTETHPRTGQSFDTEYPLSDAIDVGRLVIPAVREEVAKRDRERDLAATEVGAAEPVLA